MFPLVALTLRSVAVKHPEIPLFLNNGELVGSRKDSQAALFSICDPADLFSGPKQSPGL